MSLEVQCPHCGSIHHVNDRMAGKQVRCPQCDTPVQVSENEIIEAIAIEESEDAIEIGHEPPHSLPDERQRIPTNVGAFSGPRPEVANAHAVAAGSILLPTTPTRVAVADDDDDDDDELPAKLKPADGELDMTPMVDVTFLLLIFFMITAAFSLQKSVESPRQQSDAPSMSTKQEETEELDSVTVQIDELGSFLVLAADWERETPGKQNLVLALKEAMGESKSAMKLAIEVHEMARLQALVDCMDAGTICDYGEIQVTQVEGFD